VDTVDGDVYVTEEGVEANVEFTSCPFSCSPPKWTATRQRKDLLVVHSAHCLVPYSHACFRLNRIKPASLVHFASASFLFT